MALQSAAYKSDAFGNKNVNERQQYNKQISGGQNTASVEFTVGGSDHNKQMRGEILPGIDSIQSSPTNSRRDSEHSENNSITMTLPLSDILNGIRDFSCKNHDEVKQFVAKADIKNIVGRYSGRHSAQCYPYKIGYSQ